MDINFTEELPTGKVEFTGSLNKDEHSFLLRFALLTLLQQGVIPASIQVGIIKPEELIEAGELTNTPATDKKDIN